MRPSSTRTTWPAARAASRSCSSSSRPCTANVSSMTIGGLSFQRDGEAVHNPLRERCADLDTLPFPDLRLLVGSERLTTMPIMTSWGCPFACNFCSVTAMFGRKYRFRSAESVIAEIKDKRPSAHLLLRRQHGRRQEAPQEAPADDDRRGPRHPLVGPGAHRRGPRPGAARAHADAPAASSSTSASSRSTRRRSTATRRRRPSTTSSKASACCTSTTSAATACSCSAPTPTTCRRSATP